MLTIAMLAALGHHDKLKLHIRATQNTGVTQDEVKEILLKAAVYAGVPAANAAFKHALEAYSADGEGGRAMTESSVPYRHERAGTHPPYLHAAYGSTVKRAPSRAPLPLAQTLSETTGPGANGWSWVGAEMADLTRQHKGTPIGERMIVAGRVLDEDGRPVPNTLLEIWQCNAAGRYIHPNDHHDAPLDPNFTGAGRMVCNERGAYRFLTVKPGAYPWRNTKNAWRPAHIHFSVFGPAFATRLITQMYFPGDPLLAIDPIFQSTPDADARASLVAAYDPELSEPEWALGYRWDIVLRGRAATPVQTAAEH